MSAVPLPGVPTVARTAVVAGYLVALGAGGELSPSAALLAVALVVVWVVPLLVAATGGPVRTGPERAVPAVTGVRGRRAARGGVESPDSEGE